MTTRTTRDRQPNGPPTKPRSIRRAQSSTSRASKPDMTRCATRPRRFAVPTSLAASRRRIPPDRPSPGRFSEGIEHRLPTRRRNESSGASARASRSVRPVPDRARSGPSRISSALAAAMTIRRPSAAAQAVRKISAALGSSVPPTLAPPTSEWRGSWRRSALLFCHKSSIPGFALGGPPLRAGPPFLDLPDKSAGQPRHVAGGPEAGRRQAGGG